MCKKVKFTSDKIALKVIKRMKSKGKSDYLRPYFCLICQSWHISSMAPLDYLKKRKF